jgi:hypothetical protein
MGTEIPIYSATSLAVKNLLFSIVFPPDFVKEKTKHHAGLIALHGADHSMIAGSNLARIHFSSCKTDAKRI